MRHALTEEHGSISNAAAIMGVPCSTLQLWLSGEADISALAVEMVSDATNYSVEWIIFGTGPQMPLEEWAPNIGKYLTEALEELREAHSDGATFYEAADRLKMVIEYFKTLTSHRE